MIKRSSSPQLGFITLDFLFAFVLVMGFSGILFSLAMTLTVAELTQYITFASARNYMAGHIDQDRQVTQAKLKYRELLDNREFTNLYTNGWFQVSGEPLVGDLSQMFPGYPNGEPTNQFLGSGTYFNARMLDFKIPFYGSTTSEDRRSAGGFQTFLASYLGREVTTKECLRFMDQRWVALRGLIREYSTNTSEKGYFGYDDNGC